MVDEIQKEVKRFYTFLPLSKIFLIQNTRNDETRILRRLQLKHRKICESCQSQVTWKVKFDCQFVPSHPVHEELEIIL